MTIYTLYIKTHKKTGLKYLGQTHYDPYEYKGSGIDWKKHIKQHGDDIATQVIYSGKNRNEMASLGRYYSNLYRITTSVDDFGNRIWANRTIENGGGGWNIGYTYSAEERKKFGHTKHKGSKRTDKQKQEMKDNHADFSGSNNPNYGKKAKETTLTKMRVPKVRVCRIVDRKEMSVNELTSWIKRGCNLKDNYRHDPTIYSFTNLTTNETVTATKREMIERYNLDQSAMSRVLTGKLKSTKGWSLTL